MPERTIEITDNSPDLLKLEIDGWARHRRTPFLADQLGAMPGSWRQPCRQIGTSTGFGQFRNSEQAPLSVVNGAPA
jgi:hypothetical protein